MLKLNVYRSKKYRHWVASQDCCVSQRPGMNDPHHIKGNAMGGSVKCSDLFMIPLAHELHLEFHNIGWQSFEKKYCLNQLKAALETLERAFSAGFFRES